MHYSKEQKAKWLKDWKRSGKKAWTYAKENDLVPQTFMKWAKEIVVKKKGFVEIHPRAINTLSASEILIEKGEIKIYVPLSIGSIGLHMVMEGLGVVL